MRRFFCMTLFVAIAIALLRQPNTLTLAASVFLWLLAVSLAILRSIKAPRLSDRLFALIFLLILAIYSIFALIPDQSSSSPRRVGNDWFTKVIRMGFEPLTGWPDFEFQTFTDVSCELAESTNSDSKSVASEIENQNIVPDQFEHLIDSIRQITGSMEVDIEGFDPASVANLSGFGPSIQFEKQLELFMWMGHLFMGLFVAFLVRNFGMVFFSVQREILKKYYSTNPIGK